MLDPRTKFCRLEVLVYKVMIGITPIEEPAKVFYSVAEVAKQFGISQKSVYRLLERGLLKSSPALRRKMIPKASLDQFVGASLQGGTR